MHGLIPRLAPLSLDTFGLTATLENLVRDWQRRHPSVALALNHDLPPDLAPDVTLDDLPRRSGRGHQCVAPRAGRARAISKSARDSRDISITVTDDGIGLARGMVAARSLRPAGTRKTACVQLGGYVRCRQSATGGVRLSADIPRATVTA